MNTPVTTRKRRWAAIATRGRIPRPPASEPRLRTRTASRHRRRGVLLRERGDADLEHAERDRRQRQRRARGTRIPGVPSAPARRVPGSRGCGRQARAGARRRRRAHRRLHVMPVRNATSGEIAVAMTGGQQGAQDEHELEQERVERERGVEPLAPDQARQQRPQRGGDRRDAEPGDERQRGHERRARPPRAPPPRSRAADGGERRGGEQHLRLPDAVDHTARARAPPPRRSGPRPR